MKCAACGTGSNYHLCETCIAWLMGGGTEFVSMEGPGEADPADKD